MPMLKTVSARQGRTCDEICAYLMCDRKTGELRARGTYLQNLVADERDSAQWGVQMDSCREMLSGVGGGKGRKATRPYYHFILSPSDEDRVSAEGCLAYAREWLAENFPESAFQAAVVIHDDNKRRIADGGEGIMHAHVIVNPVCIFNRRRIQIVKGGKRRAMIERGELGPQFVHEDILADSAQRLAQARGWHSFDNDDRSYKKGHRAQTYLEQSRDNLFRDLVCNIEPSQAAELNAAFIDAGVDAKLASREDGGYTFTVPAQCLQPAQSVLDHFVELQDEGAMSAALDEVRVLAVASARGDERAEFLQEMLREASVGYELAECEAHVELSFKARSSAEVEDICNQLVESRALDPARILNAGSAFASVEVPLSLRESFENYGEVFADTAAPEPEDNLTSTEVSLRARGAYCWKDGIRSRIDSAAKRSQTMEEFKYRMNKAHIRVESWSKGLLYKDENGHAVRDSVLGVAYTRDAVAARFIKVSWVEEARRIEEEAQQKKKRLVQQTVTCYRLIAVEDARYRDVRRDLKIISELDMFLTEENVRSWDELRAREAELKKMGAEIKVDLNILGARVDRTRGFVNACEDLLYYREFAAKYDELRRSNPAQASEYYSTYFPEIDGAKRLLESIERDYGISPDEIDDARAEVNRINEQFIQKQAVFEGTARRIENIRVARDRARWVHEEVERRAARERIERGEATPKLEAVATGEKRMPKSFYKKDKAPYWTLNVTKESYKRNAERNRAARVNFKRMEPHKYASVPEYMKRDEQVRQSRIEQLRCERFAQLQPDAQARAATTCDRAQGQPGYFSAPFHPDNGRSGRTGSGR